MKLASRIQGRGPNLVLLHGWGMHAGVWDGLTAQLAHRFTCHCIDLPGHGDSECGDLPDIASWADAVRQVLPDRASCLGWSLGGLLGQALVLRNPRLFDALVLISSTPRFIQGDDWPCAIDPEVLKAFACDFADNPEAALQQFLALQVKGSRRSRTTLRELRKVVGCKPAADKDCLRAGLDILQSADFREHLADFPVPLYFLLGERDKLVPAALADSVQSSRVKLVSEAGHAPFISDPEVCAAAIGQWLAADCGMRSA